ncbi:MAG: ChbG/HpnK family deacetylase, partial [Phycisphaerae bacterium]
VARARTAGLNLTYLDEHMGIGWLAGLTEALEELARREGLRYLREHQYETASIQVFVNSADWTRQLAGRRTSALLITHPACDDKEMRSMQAQGYDIPKIVVERDQERQILCDPRNHAVLRELGIHNAQFTEETP